MVIKEKNVWYSDEDKAIVQRYVSNKDYSIDINTIKNALEKSLQDHMVPATISEGEFSYKTGFLKSAKTTCLILTNTDKAKDFKKFVFVIKQLEGKYQILCGWYGNSKSDVLRKKIKKKVKKQEKYSRKLNQESRKENGSLIDSVGYGASAMIAGKMAERRSRQLEEFISIEEEYYHSIRVAVADIYVKDEE